MEALTSLDCDILPPELWRHIFELMASNCKARKDILPYLYICKAVKAWLEPFIYHTILIDQHKSTKNPIRTLQDSSKPHSFFRAHVRRICSIWNAPNESRLQVLNICTDIQNLALYCDEKWFSDVSLSKAIVGLPSLKLLEINVVHLHQIIEEPSISRARLTEWGSSITHLTLIVWDHLNLKGPLPNLPLPDLSIFPNLTAVSTFSERNHQQLTPHILSLHPDIKVIFHCRRPDESTVHNIQELDPRIIFWNGDAEPLDNWHRLGSSPSIAWDKAKELVHLEQRWMEEQDLDADEYNTEFESYWDSE